MNEPTVQLVYLLVHDGEKCGHKNRIEITGTKNILPTDCPMKVIDKMNEKAQCWKYKFLGTVHPKVEEMKSQL